jgi:hypothetical protein
MLVTKIIGTLKLLNGRITQKTLLYAQLHGGVVFRGKSFSTQIADIIIIFQK